jgi:hypothetical protein
MTVTTDRSEEIMPAILRHLMADSNVTALLGISPCKIFPGDVPPKISGNEIKPPWVNLERGAWEEETAFSGGIGTFRCPINVVVIADTIKNAGIIYATLRLILNAKWSATWGSTLWVGESSMSLGQQVPLLEADGSPSQWQQLVGELFVLCCLVP